MILHKQSNRNIKQLSKNYNGMQYIARTNVSTIISQIPFQLHETFLSKFYYVVFLVFFSKIKLFNESDKTLNIK